jgi:hypothetical protein
MKSPLPTLQEIAARIKVHLKRFEASPAVNIEVNMRKPYYFANAWRTGRYVAVVYVSYNSPHCMEKADALAYLAWLDAGNVGTHRDLRRDPIVGRRLT